MALNHCRNSSRKESKSPSADRLGRQAHSSYSKQTACKPRSILQPLDVHSRQRSWRSHTDLSEAPNWSIIPIPGYPINNISFAAKNVRAPSRSGVRSREWRILWQLIQSRLADSASSDCFRPSSSTWRCRSSYSTFSQDFNAVGSGCGRPFSGDQQSPRLGRFG